MAEVLVHFDLPIADETGHAYTAQVCGRVAEDGHWEAWIEFDPRTGAPVLRTPRETQQSSRADLEYWATGLTAAYLEGALARARDSQVLEARPPRPAARPAYDRPAAPGAEQEPSPPRVRPRAVLDPFAIYGQGEDVLRQELGALDEGHLRNVARAYCLLPEDGVDLAVLGRVELAESIVAAVRLRAG